MNLKDAYFHIQIAPHHRRFSEVCCQGKAQRTNTLFSRSGWLGPHALFKLHRCSTSPLRSSGRCILNYLDDWLILAQSLDTLISHIDSLLIHLESLRLCVNMQKSILAPSQSITYLGVCLDSVGMRARLSRDRVEMRARLSWDRVEMRARLSWDRVEMRARLSGDSVEGEQRWICSPRARTRTARCTSLPADITLASSQAVCISSDQEMLPLVLCEHQWYSSPWTSLGSQT